MPSWASSSHSPAWKRLIRSRAVLVVLQLAGLVDQVPQLVELGAVEGEVRAGGQQHARVPGGQRGEDGGEGDVLALEGDDDAQVEPVPVPGGLVEMVTTGASLASR